MDRQLFDALARTVAARGSRRAAVAALLGAALLGQTPAPLPAKLLAKRQRKRKKKDKNSSPDGSARRYPVFTTCYTPEGEVGPIPNGPYPTCRSASEPGGFAPCDADLTFADLKAACDATYPACGRHCRIKAEPIVGLGDCPDFTDCVVTNGPNQPIPHGPYPSCWSWPDGKCESCPGHTPDYQGLKDLCGQAYPPGHPITCWDRLGRNDCYPIGCDVC